MATKYLSDQIAKFLDINGIAAAGLTGAPSYPRATEVRGLVKVYRFTVEQAAPNPMPGESDLSVATGDQFILAKLKPTDRLYFIEIFSGAWGGSTTLAIGKIDPNNSGNTDLEHYLAATSVVAAGNIFITKNMTEQVGDDPIGDQTTGNQLPSFGSADIEIVATLGGTIDTGGILVGYMLIVEEGN
jgi:hypothetical protein